MDGSYLTNEDVIDASRSFVCIRTATYEDEGEAEFLKWIFARGDNLENTVFCMLSPDGKKKLIRGGRGPMNYRNARDMAEHMEEIASEYAADPDAHVAVPRMKDVRLGLNVAACDRLPTVIVMGKTDEEITELATKLSPAAWSYELAGMFIYCSTTDAEDLAKIEGAQAESGYLVVEPGAYGLKGRVIAQIAADINSEELYDRLELAAMKFERPVKDHDQHVRNGRREGIGWETEIPVEDPMALRAQQRREGRGRQKR